MNRFLQVSLFIFLTTSFKGTSVLARSKPTKQQPIEDAPWTVIIERQGKQIALGAIVGPTTVISNTREFEDYALSSLIVRAGSNEMGRGGSVHDIIEIFTHPLASRRSNDVGVVTVNPPFELDQTRQIIPVNYNASNQGYVTVSSFNKAGLIVYSEELISYSYCNSIYMIISGILPSIGCMITEPDSGPCENDIGSPVVQDGTLIGVVGEYPICYTPDWPTTFTNFTESMTSMWVRANVPQN